MTIPIIAVIGKSKAGKTTLIEKLIGELKRRGYRVATIKHHSHPGFDIDVPGKDSWRFAQAGSDHTIIAAVDKVAAYWKIDHELTLDEIAAEVHDVDIILTEGYCRSGKPAIEIVRAQNSRELIGSREQWIALVADFPIEEDVPRFGLDEINGVVNLLEQKFLGKELLAAATE